MFLQPILEAPLAVQIHVWTVLPSAVIGAAMLAARKGTPIHKIAGRVWVGLVVATAVSSFFIHELRVIGDFSPIHLLSIVTLVSCVGIVWAARTGRNNTHRKIVLTLYWGGIGLAGFFTFMPGRIMNEVMFGRPGMAGLVALPSFWASVAAAALALSALAASRRRSA